MYKQSNPKFFFILMLLIASQVFSQATTENAKSDTLIKESSEPKKETKKWYDHISVRGYAQVRYNQLLVTNPDLTNEQGDKSIGENNGFFLRRARIIFSGKLNDHVSFYFQPDFVNNLDPTRQHFVQLRDLYMDLGIDKKMQYRFRIGQSKVPFGFENMQSSQNRVTLDRADPTNSALSNERDLGAFFYWTPENVGELLSELQNGALKGSGNYGMFAFGVFNGQTGNYAEANNKRHLVTRFSYPVRIGSQIIEGGIQAYTGDYVVTKKSSKIDSPDEFKDERVGATFVLYPKPFGIQAEYNIGKGPAFSNADSTIKTRDLKGGYVQLIYALKVGKQRFNTYGKYQAYDGGKKHEQDARQYLVKETEVGVEWQPLKAFELTVAYSMMDRRTMDYSKMNHIMVGNLMRIQAQVNF